ncbi:MAG: hypothetical protein A2622_14295 [Bdellovibrionales bacterium RIFCSPHIGHO2_01_FULL_40_29]|nr:MAG: hypothetical protein A2622_14295 [Bdellovibrionales bacterium RIFCSPHIGHO2_01_FULL_40_29]OFZ33689.1 MAG: hypothetical protein A3D17_11905 [Bdellovibrionales bacterium RIFCSPHIGHO2_02_FULL_40_15]
MRTFINSSISLIALILISACGRGPHNPVDGDFKLDKANRPTAGQTVSAITFADVKPIFQKCTTCHGAGKANATDWLDYSSAASKKVQLMDRVIIKGDMPLGFKLEKEELKTLATWLKTGTLPEPDGSVADTPENPPIEAPVDVPVEAPPVVQPTEPTAPEAPVVDEPVSTPWPANLISIKKIFDESCLMCHTGAMPNAPDWQNYAVVESKKDRIYNRVLVVKDMPMAVTITDEKREIIKNWLDGKPMQITPWPEKYSNARDIVAVNCTACHNADSGLPNWSDYAVVESKFSEIRNRLFVTKDMPYSGPMQPSDLDIIKNWLDDVAPKELE